VRIAGLLPAIAALLATTGCLASKGDVRLLQDELRASRAAAARSDTAQALRDETIARNLNATLAAISSAQRASSDSLRQVALRLDALTRAVDAFRLSTTDSLRSLSNQVGIMREMQTMLASQIPELKSAVSAATERFNAASAALTTPASTAPDTSAAARAARPEVPPAPELLRLAKSALASGSCRSARNTLSDLMSAYPNDELVPDAMIATAESYRICATDRNNSVADSVYGEIVARFPDRPAAPLALFRQADIRGGATNADARALYERIIREYPRSDPARLACDKLNRTTRCP
jgi:TolA-binding protein